jgi:hypothetical protein
MANYYTTVCFEIDFGSPEIAQAALATIHAWCEENEEDAFVNPTAFEINPGRPNHVYVCEAEGDVGDMAKAIQSALIVHMPKAIIGFTYADTCDRDRLNAFGGGAVIVTATAIEHHSAGDIVAKRVEALTSETAPA